MNRSAGFTLLELLMATVLAAMLMIGVMAVVADLGRRSIGPSAAPVSDRAGDDDPTVQALVRLLSQDIEQAGELDSSQPNRLLLIGYCGLDDMSRGRLHRPVLVSYQIETIGGRSWLVRRQMLQDVLTNQNIQRDLVCTDVTGFHVTPPTRSASAGLAQAMDAGPSGASKSAVADPVNASSSGSTPMNLAGNPQLININGQWYELQNGLPPSMSGTTGTSSLPAVAPAPAAAPSPKPTPARRVPPARRPPGARGAPNTAKDRPAAAAKPVAPSETGVAMRLRLERRDQVPQSLECVLTVYWKHD